VDVDPSARTRKGKQFPPIQEKTRQWEERWHKRSSLKKKSDSPFPYPTGDYKKLELINRARDWALTGEIIHVEKGETSWFKGHKHIFNLPLDPYSPLPEVWGILRDGIEFATIMVPKPQRVSEETREWEERWHKRSSMDKKAFFRVWNNNTESPIHIPSQAVTLEQFIEDAWRVLGPAGLETETPEAKYSILFNNGYIIQDIPDTSRLEAPETEKTREWEQRWHKRSGLEKKAENVYNGDRFEVIKEGPYYDEVSDGNVFVDKGEIGTVVGDYISIWHNEKISIELDNSEYMVQIPIENIKPLNTTKAIEWLERWHKRSELVQR
jgi:hypothetical protein